MSSINGKEIYEALLSVRRFHQQVALLLKTADDSLIGEYDFKARLGGRAVADGSDRVDAPAKWMPGYVFRSFTPPAPKDSRWLVFISVILCRRAWDEEALPFDQPLVSAGYVRFRDDSSEQQRNQYWWTKMQLWTDVPRDGTPHHDSAEPGVKSEYGDLEAFCFGYPLVGIENSDDLLNKIIKPLVEALKASK